MAVSATGTPTTNYSFPTLNVNVDAPDGVGINNIITDIDTKLKTVVEKKGLVYAIALGS